MDEKMKVEELIKNLMASELYAECPCGEEFKLSDAILFDGTKTFPKDALEAQATLLRSLKEREDILAKKISQITEKTAITTRATNLGNFLELALPTAKDFRWIVPDSKFLGKPIDLLVFNGLSRGKVESLSFVEVKSGKTHRLSDNEKSIRDAIKDHKVSYKVFV
jgi:predicted Holliday junction resolvase-like endonuclease